MIQPRRCCRCLLQVGGVRAGATLCGQPFDSFLPAPLQAGIREWTAQGQQFPEHYRQGEDVGPTVEAVRRPLMPRIDAALAQRSNRPLIPSSMTSSLREVQ